MERKSLILSLLVVLILVFSSCHPRHAFDVKPNMTKEEVVSLWGRTPLITYRTVDGRTIETWEYHFLNSDSICWVIFSQDRVAGTECRQQPHPEPYYYTSPYYPYYYYPYPYYYGGYYDYYRHYHYPYHYPYHHRRHRR